MDKVALYQAVEATLMLRDTDLVAPTASIASDREALVRVFASPTSEWRRRAVVAELAIENDGMTTTTSVRRVPQDGSTQAELSSTWNLEIPADRMKVDTTARVRLVDEGSGEEIVAWPENDSFALRAVSTNGPLEVVMVPMSANGFEPLLDAPTVARAASLLRSMYGISDVVIDVRDPIAAPVAVEPGSAGWAQALDALFAARQDNQPANNVFYYGVLTPAPSYDEYCPTTCTVGAGIIAAPDDIDYRGAIGIGFFETPSDRLALETMAHELGHALGRAHSPCDTGESNGFPYIDGSIGGWGFDGVALLDPREFADVMGYCSPAWMSDHHADAILERLGYVNTPLETQAAFPPTRRAYRRLVLDSEGGLYWGNVQYGAPTLAETRTLDLRDAQGELLLRVDVPFVAFDHIEGGFLLVPLEAIETEGALTLTTSGSAIAVKH